MLWLGHERNLPFHFCQLWAVNQIIQVSLFCARRFVSRCSKPIKLHNWFPQVCLGWAWVWVYFEYQIETAFSKDFVLLSFKSILLKGHIPLAVLYKMFIESQNIDVHINYSGFYSHLVLLSTLKSTTTPFHWVTVKMKVWRSQLPTPGYFSYIAISNSTILKQVSASKTISWC